MTEYEVSWGSTDPAGGTEKISTAAELDQILDRVEHLLSRDGLSFLVTITELGSGDGLIEYGLQIGVGHPHRSRLVYVGPPAGGIGYSPDLPPWDGGDISFDFGGVPTEDSTDHTRITPHLARQAAREYVSTGQRPTCVSWQT
jgi:hypothetical protein